MFTAPSSQPSALEIAVFAVGDRRFTANDIVTAAWFRGDVQFSWQEFRAGLAAELHAEAQGLTPDGEALQTVSEEARYRHDLITAEETEAWLTARNLTLDDLTAYSLRRFWREHAVVSSPPTPLDYCEATPEQRAQFVAERMIDGEFEAWVRALSWRVADPVATGRSDPAWAARIEAERSRFFARTHLEPAALADALEGLDRGKEWFDSLLEQESDHGWNCEHVRSPENRARTLAMLRLPLTRFEIETMDFESADAVREACFCLTTDGLSIEKLGAQEKRRTERREVLLEEFPQELQPLFLSAQKKQVLPLITSDERFQVCRILHKHEPTVADEKVVARVDAELLAAHFGNLVAKHTVRLLGPGVSAP